jgi:uncharacterized protein YbjT (DUF2867 family)
MDKRKIVVFGATGKQGGVVVKALLASSLWKVSAVTRDPSSAAACSLRDSGVEILQADLHNQTSVSAAVKDAYGVFAVTQPWSETEGRYNAERKSYKAKTLSGHVRWRK